MLREVGWGGGRAAAGGRPVGRPCSFGALCSGEKFLPKGRTITAEGRTFPRARAAGGPWRGGLCLRRPAAVPARCCPAGGWGRGTELRP